MKVKINTIFTLESGKILEFFDFENGTRSHDVLGKLFARIDVENFQTVFLKFINSISKLTEGENVPIDGKTIKCSGDSDKPNSAIHLVLAYAAKQNLCLGQTVVDKEQWGGLIYFSSNPIMVIFLTNIHNCNGIL